MCKIVYSNDMKRILAPLLCIAVLIVGCRQKQGSGLDLLSLQELHAQASAYYNVKDLDSVNITANRMLALLHPDSLSPYWGHALVHKGIVQELEGRYDSAAYYYYDALRKAEAIDDKPLLARTLNNLGILHFSLHNTEEAVTHYKRFLSVARELGDSVQVCKALNNIGNAYATLENDFEKATPWLENCVQVAEAIGDDEAYVSAKLILVQIQSARGDFRKGLESINQIRARGVNHYYVDYTEADIYHKTKEYAKAIVLYEQILQMKLNSRELLLAVYTQLSMVHKEMGDWQSALDYKDKYQLGRDSLHKIEIQEAVEMLKITHDTEQKEMAIALLEKEKYFYLWIGLAGVLGLLLVLLVLLFRQRLIRQKKELAEHRISELEKEKQLIATQAVLDGETAERSRLARDLHDGLGSMLTGVKLNLESAKKDIAPQDTLLPHFDTAFNMLNASMLELRRVAHHLMPDSLNRYGLKTALTDFCNHFPLIQFDYFGSEERLGSKMEVMIYRIVHELVNNALKHSGASQIMVQIMRENDYIGLIVRDNGSGFDPARESGGGMGLQNIHARVASYNGRMEIASRAGEGTEINIEFNTAT